MLSKLKFWKNALSCFSLNRTAVSKAVCRNVYLVGTGGKSSVAVWYFVLVGT